MVVKVYISGISASKEVKKRQQRAQMLLDSLKVKYDLVDITEPGHESEKELMKNVCKKRNNNTIALPPQFFNDDQYCGDYEDLESASDDDMVLSFLKLEEDITIENGDVSPNEGNNDIIESTPFVNGEEDKVHINGDNDIDEDEDDIVEEVVEEVVTVEEKLTLGGKVIDIPVDRKLEIGGKKIDLNELILNKEEINNAVKENEGISVDNTQQNLSLDQNKMDVEENDEQNNDIKDRDNRVEQNVSQSDDEEVEDEEDEDKSQD